MNLLFLISLAIIQNSYRIWMVVKSRGDVKKSLILYGFQLFLNFLWSIIFSGLDYTLLLF
nr:tryptophan-rich sensory protein [Clostridium estertheticum]